MIETQKSKNRFTEEEVRAVRFTGSQDQLVDILDWVIEHGGRAQGDLRSDGGLDLMVHERGVGLVKVKPGEFVVKSESSGFEVLPMLAFTQTYKKVASVVKVIQKPIVIEAMQFDGSKQNEKELKEWLAEDQHSGKYIHTIPGTSRTYYRIEMSESAGLIDIVLNNWIVKVDDELPLRSMTDEEFADAYQRVI
ncbi:hypothetical protein PP914_gp127 [Arthrobacter phage Qui]|uniref:Uncharacterized protein n=1 Tax=Arthrobacter phage Qui TaxID=2603260 RepID=A0A5B8WK64_9CAUD|nr:hypothetical protein PP914_gp127 [Arthrobacter phage Qui]QED11616.1 hypothetical protein SEA_QUI_127 [Arthrobacter phage Qui]QOC56448.1 hypothetical protein SEA_PAELLA_127 [Arthrobacter phage Paella]